MERIGLLITRMCARTGCRIVNKVTEQKDGTFHEEVILDAETPRHIEEGGFTLAKGSEDAGRNWAR